MVKVSIFSVQPLTHDKKIRDIQIIPMRAGGENFRLYSTFNYIKKAHLLINNFYILLSPILYMYQICIFFLYSVVCRLVGGPQSELFITFVNGPAHYLKQLNAGCRQWSDADTNGLLD